MAVPLVGAAGWKTRREDAMFVDRMKEDRILSAARPGLLDAMVARLRELRLSRRLASARARLFTPGRELSVRLGAGNQLAMGGYRRCRVDCLRGAVWLTVEGDGRDRVLTPGQDITLARGGKLVLSGRGERTEVKVQWD